MEREMIDRLKENFMHQLSVYYATGGEPVKMLKARAILVNVCSAYFDISDAVNELIRENKITIQFLGDEPYLWLKR